VAGVRGAAPDGLPIAGALPVPGLFAATAPRRNGWLLAPMVAEVVAAAIAGETDALAGNAFRPDRFGPA
jgi:glycine oxidase